MEEENYKQKAEDYIIAVDEFAKGALHNAEDLTRIMEVVIKNDKQKKLEDLAFTAKYSIGLMKIFQDRSNEFEEEYFEKIRDEYTEAIKKVKSLLEEILDEATSFISGIFKEKYLGMTHGSMNNLNMLIEDLSWVKMYLNEQKR